MAILAALSVLPDEEIDTSDIPELPPEASGRTRYEGASIGP